MTAVRWCLAVAPVLLLLALVLWGRFGTAINAVITVAAGTVIAVTAFGAGPEVVAVGLGKGAWLGVWILLVIWPALLLHRMADRVGMADLGASLGRLLPRRTENVLLLAWILPSFLQGVSGFGTPIAITAPLLVAVGVEPVLAVALPLVGYHWAVGFGSMGSSFYMSALTAHLDHAQVHAFAASTSVLLGVNAMLSGVLVAVMYAGRTGLAEGWRVLCTAGPAMAAVQALSVHGEPAIGALCAGTAGLLVVLALQVRPRLRSRGVVTSPGAPERASVPDRDGDGGLTRSPDIAATLLEGAEDASARLRRARAAALPYVVLSVVALAVFMPSGLRSWVKGHLLLGPSFPATHTSRGIVNPAVHTYNPIALLGHPGTFLLVSCAISLVVWRMAGLWPTGTGRELLGRWLRQAGRATPSVLLLAAVANLLVDSGMVRTVATGAAAVAGHAYPAVAPIVGSLGSFVTGSTTSSNALFSALQREVATLLGDRPADLLAAQSAGGNIGNSLAPVVILLGVSAVGSQTTVGEVLRRTLPAALVLTTSAVIGTLTLVALHR